MKKVVMIFLIMVMAVLFSGCEGCARSMKSISSNIGGGLDRTVTVYSNTGDKIKSWNGKFDVSSSETETYFDLNGKRVIIHGGIVIDEEN